MKYKINTTHNRKITNNTCFSLHHLNIFVLLIFSALLISHTASATELHVGPGQTFSTIQSAVDAALNGDIIIVHAGNYIENVDVNKSLTLQGESAIVVTVTAASYSAHAFKVTANYVNISGFTLTGATGGATGGSKAGIYLEHAGNCNIYDNTALNNGYGINLRFSSNNMLTNNTILYSDSDGIFLWDSSNNILTNNTANSNNYDGISLVESSNNTLINNIANLNVNFGIDISHSNSNMLTNNTINSNDFYGIRLASDNNVLMNNHASNNSRGIKILGSDNILLSNNASKNNESGIEISSSNNTLQSNIANSNNRRGIFLQGSNHTILGNTALNNDWNGIELSGSNNNTLINNNASYNGKGIFVYHSSNHNILQNNIVKNNIIGFYLSDLNDNMLINNTASDNDDGIELFFSTNITLTNNTVKSNNNSGIRLTSCNNSAVLNNNVLNNSDGIYLKSSNYNTITNNIASNNQNGICLVRYSCNNIIYLNDFINNNNSYLILINSNNTWNSTGPITYTYNSSTFTSRLGNYWSDYNEKYPYAGEINGCGIRDTPYSIDSDKDNYPLIKPSDNYLSIVNDLPTITIDPVISPTTIDSQIINGTKEKEINITVICPTATVGYVDYPTDTTWSVNITNLTQGENVITITATDPTGNFSTTTVIIEYKISVTTGNEIVSICSSVVDVNDTIVIPITIANVSNIQQVALDLIYDSGVVSITNITANSTIPSLTLTSTLEAGKATIELTSSDNLTVTSATGLINITFKAGENTGATELNLQDVKLVDYTGTHTPDTIINGSITVCIKGDFNNNNIVDIGDASKVVFMVAEKVSEDMRADFNNNDRVDVGDATKIVYYLAEKVSEL